MFWKILPESRHFARLRCALRRCLSTFVCTGGPGITVIVRRRLFADGVVRHLFNYIGYRLMLSPWHVSQAVLAYYRWLI